MDKTLNAMTVGEFKAWLEGFEEAMGSSPNIKQWKKIKERFACVQTDRVVGYPYYPTRSWWPINWYMSTTTTSNPTTTLTVNAATGDFKIENDSIYTNANDIGKFEAVELN